LELCRELLDNKSLKGSQRMLVSNIMESLVGNADSEYVKYPKDIIANIQKRKGPYQTTFTITTCKRLKLFKRTMNSFINCCKDIDQIGRWICVDDNSSQSDKNSMKKLYPFIEFIWKTPDQRGHAKSMNIIRETVDTPFVLHMEDDWQFYVKQNYIIPSIQLLNKESKYGQVIFNRNYAEIPDDKKIPGIPKSIRNSLQIILEQLQMFTGRTTL